MRISRFFLYLNIIFRKFGLIGLPADYNYEERAQLLEGEAVLDEFYGEDLDKKQSPRQIAWNNIRILNIDQRKAFEKISEAIIGKNSQKLFFIEGEGGTGTLHLDFLVDFLGKTYLYNTLIRWCLAGKPEEETHGSMEDASKKVFFFCYY